MNYTVAEYDDYNPRRYSTPWLAKCDSSGRPDFKSEVGHFTGGRGKGGCLYVCDPEDGCVYVFGRKDYRGSNSTKEYVCFKNGVFIPVKPNELLAYISTFEESRNDKLAISDKRKDEIIAILLNRLLELADGHTKYVEDLPITKAEITKYQPVL